MAVAPCSPQASIRSSKRACMDEGADPVSEEVQEHLDQVLMRQFTVFVEKLERRQALRNSFVIEGTKQHAASLVAAHERSREEMAASLQELHRRQEAHLNDQHRIMEEMRRQKQ